MIGTIRKLMKQFTWVLDTTIYILDFFTEVGIFKDSGY